jgi:DNA sulfur modification protein DndC
METMDLFGMDTADEDDAPSGVINFIPYQKETPEQRAMRRIRSVFQRNSPAAVMFSSGKDSSCLALLVLNTAREFIAEGNKCPPVVVVSADTGIEQPEIVALAKSEMQKMKVYASEHGIDLTVRISRPRLSDSWPVRVIGGLALPAFPDSRADCSIDWKRLPNQRTLAEVVKSFNEDGHWGPPVVMTGVRKSESISRDMKIARRGETADEIWTNDDGHLRISPILDLSLDDVWEQIGLASAGLIPSYSDFTDLMRIYSDAGGDSCVIVADMKGSSKPCGTRTGCHQCTRVAVDHSMEEMIKSDPNRYGHLKPLARLRNFISHTQYDWTLRQFVGRTISADGDIEIGADTYSPDMLKNLLRWTLSAQIQSGVPIISYEQLVAIDLRWSMYCLTPPFTGLKIYFEVVDGGMLSDPPDVPRFPKTPVPKIGKLKVGAPTYGAALPGQVTGLRNVALEMFSETCGDTLRQLPNGSIVIDVETEGEMEVDPEGAADFIFFEGERMVEEYCHEDCSDWTWGYKTYLQWGVLSIAKGRSTQVNTILERSQWRQANGLHGQQTIQSLTERCTSLHAAQLLLIN